MKTRIYFLSILFAFTLIACEEQSGPTGNGGNPNSPNGGGDGNSQQNNDWLIPFNEVKDGGPGKDGIPALTNPELISANAASYVNDSELIIGYSNGEIAVAYPHKILDQHEIVNDDIGDESIAVIYCPLTGTGVGWDRIVDGEHKTTFGVSGLLYNTNVIPYDRQTNSNWSQILLKSVNGELSGTLAKNYILIETTWGTWKKMYPDTKVLSSNTGYNKNYDHYPYRDYRTNHSYFLFSYSHQDGRRPNKERVLGILINEKAKAYTFDNYRDQIKIVEDIFQGVNLAVVGSESDNFIIAFDREIEDEVILDFTALQNSFPAIMIDNEGTEWDASGRGVSGPRTGQQLKKVTQFIGYWFAWATFYPNMDL